jgi:hypothetical protein
MNMKTRNKVIIGALLVVVVLRLMLPGLAKSYMNKQLNAIKGYHASIEDVSIQLYRAGFQIRGLRIVEEAAIDTAIVMVELPLLDFSIQWGALFDGRFVAEVYMDSPVLNLSRMAEADAQKGGEYRIAFFEEIQHLNPMTLNYFEVKNGKLAYRDPSAQPEVDISLEDLNIIGTNLGNVKSSLQALPAHVALSATAMGKGALEINAKLNMLKPIPDFDVDLKLEKAQIVDFNALIDDKSGLAMQAGLLYFYMEAAARDGQIEGYVKPVIEGLKIDKSKDASLLQTVYEGASQVLANVMENKKEDQIATRIEITGQLDQAETSVFRGLLNLFRNAFLKAYTREIEHVVNYRGEKKTE